MRSCSLRSVCSGSVILVAFALYLQIGYVRSSGKPAVPGLAAYPDVLLVFEYDGSFDWEVVHKDARTKDAVEWMRNLPDRLTQTSADPAGQELLVLRQLFIPEAVQHLRIVNGLPQDISLRAVIDGQLSKETRTIMLPKPLLVLYQLTLLPDGPKAANLHVTLARTFWRAAEATNEAEQLVYKQALHDQAQLIVPITGYVVLLHGNFVVHGQELWQGDFVSYKYRDHSLWNNAFLVELMDYLLEKAEARSIPALDEFAWRMDKVQMLQVFKRKDEQDPTHCVSAIPSQIVQPPVPAEVLADLCYSARYEPDKVAPAVAAGHVHATAVALLHAAHILESDPHAQRLQQDNQVAGGNPRRKYFLKRNYAGMSSAVASFTLTNACSWQEDQSLPMPFRGAALPLDQQNNSTACQHDFQAMLLDAQQLNSAAEKIVRHSCQEDWLLQPYISDIQEYRVFLIGGANASVPHEVVAVFVPTAFNGNQMMAHNITLPAGFFSARGDSHHPDQPARLKELYPNGSWTDIYFEDYFPYPIWRDEEMHALLVDAALHFADAVASSGRPIRSGQHLMLRVDLVLINSDSKVKVYVNEAHYFNDAVMFTSIWSSPARAKGSRRRKHGLSSQAYVNQSNTCALQLEQESAQPFSQSAMHGFVYPGDCENATEAAEGQIFGLVSSANAPVQLASSTVQVDCAAASTGLLLARRLWQEVVAVSAGHAQTKLEVLDHET